MISINSRYVTTPLQYILDGRGLTTRPTILRDAVEIEDTRQFYRWRAFDRVDQLGHRYEDDSRYWWRVLDRNTEILDPLNIAVNTKVSVK